MSDLMCDFPATTAFIRAKYLYDQDDYRVPEGGEHEPIYVFGVTSIEAKAILFTVMTDQGIQRDHVPISAICSKPHRQHWELDNHELWNSFSYHPAILEYEFLKKLRCQVKLRDKSVHWGTYICTLDWYGNRIAEMPGEAGHKCAHIVTLDCGCWVAQPNHRILWRESSFVTRPLDWGGELPRHSVNTRDWSVEQNPKWVTSDDDRWFYDSEEK